jgi:hypothetical protein
VRPDDRAVEEEGVDLLEILRQPLEELPPTPGFLPASEPLVHGVPVAELFGEVAPRFAGAGQIQDGLDEVAIALLRGRPGS